MFEVQDAFCPRSYFVARWSRRLIEVDHAKSNVFLNRSFIGFVSKTGISLLFSLCHNLSLRRPRSLDSVHLDLVRKDLGVKRVGIMKNLCQVKERFSVLETRQHLQC